MNFNALLFASAEARRAVCYEQKAICTERAWNMVVHARIISRIIAACEPSMLLSGSAPASTLAPAFGSSAPPPAPAASGGVLRLGKRDARFHTLPPEPYVRRRKSRLVGQRPSSSLQRDA